MPGTRPAGQREQLARAQRGAPAFETRAASSRENARQNVQFCEEGMVARRDSGYAFGVRPPPYWRSNTGICRRSRYTKHQPTIWRYFVTARDGRIIAVENEVRVLRALHRFGWLRTRDLAALLWQQWQKSPPAESDLKRPTPSASGWRMAQRTLRRLVDARQVLRGQAPNGSVIYALSEAGSRRLQQFGVPALSGKDLIRAFSSAQFQHRSVANEVAISGILVGYRVSTEREIAQDKWLGGVDGVDGKKPDVVLQANGRVWWYEVERSRKNAKDYARLLKWLQSVRRDALPGRESVMLGKGLRWARIVFICTPAFRSKLLRDLEAAGWQKDTVETLITFETTLYSFADMLFV